MEFNLKSENRKKFQDKSKLKRHHKKNYAKVVKPIDKVEKSKLEDSEDSEVELDENGNPIIEETSDDEAEPHLDADGNVIPKPRSKKKLQSNAWRYTEDFDDLEDIESAGELQDILNDIDFKKLSLNKEIDLGKGYKKVNISQMTNAELSKIKIIDEVSKNNEKPINKVIQDDEFFNENLSNPIIPIHKEVVEEEKNVQSNKTPSYLKSDEAFLDDLL
ncbi:hypothetical protein WICMUC_001948 [Wickerhamomyces mucosus]|uniref:Uncharacterized protein n=1 Tax=Wickerhamomyces mucosus TaxID=1378264 RepID=A0A9P8PRM0_9ASCO|nr:hypothetical protein WICMUC_001948 [Wickerhamomyces mucosus]